ncbi:MAG: small ribosomal subunit biogenesis GTPase RsgA, partial [Gammaproteobacteria bacterium]|nr:small ribosomal subunit biogenesis GTPase RsgA [Gammaproteobacteria bacterium]
IAHYGDKVDVETPEKAVFRCNLRRNMPQIVVGDSVAWQIDAGEQHQGVVTALKPRHSEMVRRNQKGEKKIVAANVDQIFVVAAPEPARSENVLDRYLIMTELQQINAGIVINKIDMLSDEEIVDKHELLIRYKRLGYPLLYTSADEEHGFDELRAALKDKITVFVGLSGVGKTSLIQTLLPGQQLTVGALSEQSAQGQHTTTTARLYHLPGGGSIIDSPGVREFALEGLTEQEILDGFIEFKPYLGRCKFRDCRHLQEPGCAILAAADIHPLRLAAYWQIVEQLE